MMLAKFLPNIIIITQFRLWRFVLSNQHFCTLTRRICRYGMVLGITTQETGRQLTVSPPMDPIGCGWTGCGWGLARGVGVRCFSWHRQGGEGRGRWEPGVAMLSQHSNLHIEPCAKDLPMRYICMCSLEVCTEPTICCFLDSCTGFKLASNPGLLMPPWSHQLGSSPLLSFRLTCMPGTQPAPVVKC